MVIDRPDELLLMTYAKKISPLDRQRFLRKIKVSMITKNSAMYYYLVVIFFFFCK